MSEVIVNRIYIAGPMTGVPQFNIPAFERAASRLRAAGYNVVSPVELDSQEIRAEALASPDGLMPATGKIGGETWGEILARDVRVIADTVDAICVLPYWYRSRGARLEVFVALLCNKPVFLDHGFEPSMPVSLELIPKHEVIEYIARSFA